MKTVVLGLFDDLETARRVLNQLAASPLDLDQISVVHGDLDTQRSLAREAGLPAHRSPLAGTVAGALAGAALGGYAGATLVPESVGWLLAMALGAVLGAAAGAALGALSETVRVPKAHQAEVLTALEGGATALIVRSESLPTARAVGDLFRVAGSRELSPLGPVPAAAAGAGPDLATAADALVTAGGETVLDEGVVAEPLGEAFAPAPADDHARFAPPPAEAGGAIDAPAAPTATDRLAGTGGPAASAAAPAAGETLYAPPWRRGVVDPADAAPAPTATPAPAPHPTPSPPSMPAATPSSPIVTPTPPEETRTPPAATPGPSAAPPTAPAPATPADPAASTDVAGAAGAAPVAGRAATHRLARLLLDAIDEVESGAPPAEPAKAARTPRKRATPPSSPSSP